MVLYLGTDAQLETMEFSPENPAFYVGTLVSFYTTPALASETEDAVRKHLSEPHVYTLGSHTSCGCGFGYGQNPEWYAWAAEFPDQVDQDPDEPVARRQLADFLHSLLEADHTAEVYACWSGDEDQPPDHRSRVQPEAFLNPSAVQERHHLVVASS